MVYHNLDLNRLYGAGWQQRINSKIRNINPGPSSKYHSNTHHCDYCGKARSKKCLDELHLGFCTAVVREAKTGRDMFCGEVFTVRSPSGCGKHKFSEGYNHCFVNAARGLPHEMPEYIPNDRLGNPEASRLDQNVQRPDVVDDAKTKLKRRSDAPKPTVVETDEFYDDPECYSRYRLSATYKAKPPPKESTKIIRRQSKLGRK